MARKSVRVREHWRRRPRKRKDELSGVQVVVLVGALLAGAVLLNRLGR